MKDIGSALSAVVDVPSAIIRNGNTATNGDGTDLAGFNGALVVFFSGVLTDGTLACKVQEDDQSNFATASDVAAADIVGGTNLVSFAITDDKVVKELGYIGKKRYIRGVITQAAASTGGYYGSVIVRGAALKQP